MKKTRYYVHWDFGVHRAIVETNEKDFHELVNEMSTEFTIFKSSVDGVGLDGSRTTYTDYKVRNYYGDLQIIGQTETVES